MKKILVSFICLILAVLFTSCEKWLDVKSKTEVVQSDLFTNEQGFKDAGAGIYFTMAGKPLYGDHLTMSFLDVIAHRYSITGYPGNGDYSIGYNEPGYYETEFIKPKIADIWSNMYNAIANANNLIINADAQSGILTPVNYKLIKGEAIGLRAFLHFDLLRMFGPSYLAAKDSLSIPYVTIFTGKVTTPLSTVKAITDSIIKDLNAAAILLQEDDINGTSLDNSWLNNRVSHFNKWAVEATLARVYLYKGDKANALLHATNVINSQKFRFTNLQELNNSPIDYSFSREHIFSLAKYDLKQQEIDYFLTPYGQSELTNDCGGDGNNNEQSVERIYETNNGGSTDFRYKYSWQAYNSFYFPTKFWSSNALKTNVVPIMRLPEMFYIAAESSAPPQATTFLNIVRANRGLAALPNGLNATEIQLEIFKEYQKEFYCEGQLFYYYKRVNADVILENDNLSSVTPDYVFRLPEEERQFYGR